ncbi:MAG: hypothetical protein KIT84_44075 [Labilithrix sp.]|nr:hypothetical protein [Labilithrix sp.]MCW5818057.1 hypothetical protein [Labilithrix sp.]
MLLRRAVLLAPLLVAACSASPDSDPETAEGEAVGAYGDRVGQDMLTTTEPGITLFDGYNALFDLRRTGCVSAAANGPPPSVGQPSQATTIKLVKTDTELAKELGVDVSLSVKAPLVSANASGSLLRSFRSTTTSVNYLIQAVQSYVVVSNAPVNLTDDALSMLTSRPQDFLVRCGDRFVNAVTYQAKIEALITFETSSEEQALRLQGQISAGGTVAAVVGLDGSIKSRLTDASKREDVRSSVTVTAQGFDLTGNETLVGIEGTLEEKLTKIDGASVALRRSLQGDRDKDAAGFFQHFTRRAIPAALHVTRYGMAANAPVGVDASAPFKQNQKMMRDTESYLRAFGQQKLKMERAWRYEISDFQQAAGENQAYYNVAPPGEPKRRVEDVAAVASKWAARFRSDDGIMLGTDLAAVEDMISTCAENAKSGDFTDCKPGTNPATLPEYLAAQAAIDEYLHTGRVLRMRAFVIDNGAGKTYARAQAACANNGGFVNRLATLEEARLLGPLVAGLGGGTQKSTWVADTSSCRYANSGLSYYENAPGRADGAGCDAWDWFGGGPSRAVICVQQSGPVGRRDDL